jgi:outer membrane protein
MKNLATVFSALALIGVLILFGMHFSGKKNDGPAASTSGINPGTAMVNGEGRIAYVNIDTLEAHYEYLKNKKDQFKKRQQDVDAELQRSAQQIQNDYMNVQKKAQNNTLTQSEYEAAEKRLTQMQQSLETRKQVLTEQLLKEQDDFNKDLQQRLDKFLEGYNKDKHYDYILSYSQGGSILFTNKDLDITNDVIKGMNSTVSQNSDTTKKNK